MKKHFVLPGVAAAVLLFASSASATPADERWAGWIGCWRAEGAPASEVLCIVPAGEGVRMITLSSGKVVSETRVFADAEPRPVSEGGCEGTETAQWSSDGFRLFTRADLTCGADVRRNVTGIIAMVTPKQWVNAQSIGAGDLAYSRTVRYTATDLSGVPSDIVALATQKALSQETTRHASTEPLDLGDVTEAVRMVDYSAVEALVLARNDRFDLNAKALVSLDAQGVPGSLIDALVAVSHPEEFAVLAEPEEQAWAAAAGNSRDAMSRIYAARLCSSWGNAYDPWMDPFAAYDLSQLCYGSYLGMSRYGSRFGWGRYGLGYGYTPIIVVRNPQTENPVVQRRGTVSRNGYRSGTSSNGSARSRSDDFPSRSSSVGSGSSGSSSSGSTTSTTSSSSGSSSSSTGRAVKPRGSGG